MTEENIPPIIFPAIPISADEEMTNYLIELERTLQDALKGSIYMNTVLRDGFLGN
jgi:hypothetical protein